MHTLLARLTTALLLVSLGFEVAAQESNRPVRNSGLGGYTKVTEAGDVPEHLYNIVLGRPTEKSMVASVVTHKDMSAYIVYGTKPSQYEFKTAAVQISSGTPHEFVLDKLVPDTGYYYQLKYQLNEGNEFSSFQYQFNTPRAFGSDFKFTVQADSHLDENTSGPNYLGALNNSFDAGTDFHLALGDTFMTAKYVEHELSEPHYLAQRYYFGTALNHSAPLFFALGNHDAEIGSRSADTRNWATKTRNKYFPNPSPNEFYSGSADLTPDGDPVRNYYSFEWGNSMFIALDAFRYNDRKSGDDNWYMTLGKDQYDWLTKALSESKSTFKFVYLHNLIGGDVSNRGGAEASWNFEWGGHDYDGTYTFDKNRPGWDKPIHDLLVEHNVSAVFHGHDHMYIHQERDGIVYQLVPQPAHPSGNVNSAATYGYLSGNIVAGSGTLTVSVSDDEAMVEFVDSRDSGRSGDILHSYVINAVAD